MDEPSSFKAYFVVGVLAVAGGAMTASALSGDGAQRPDRSEMGAYAMTAPLPPAPSAPPPRAEEQRNEIRNARFGFRFRHPEGWTTSPPVDRATVASVGRGDGVSCSVSVRAQNLTTDAEGRPYNLGALLAAFAPADLAGPAFASVPTKVQHFAASIWGGQESRAFSIAASVPVAGTLHLEGEATLRKHGTLVLTCMAPAALHANADVREAFALVRKSFAFE